MQKIITFILAAAMLFNVTAFAAEEELTPKHSEVFEPKVYEQIKMMYAFGNSDVSDIAPEAAVSREQLANIAANMLGIGNEAGGGEGFIDISQSPFRGQIIALSKMKIINGVNAYQFMPAAPVSLQQAVTVIVSVLGYAPLAEAKGGYPTGFMSIASNLSILPKKVRNNNSLIWAEVAEMMANCAETPIMSIVGIGEANLYNSQKDITYLSRYHNIKKISGRITDNGITALNGKTTIGKNSVKIDGDSFLKGNTKADELIGRMVNAFYKDDDLKTVLYIVTDSKSDDMLMIEAEDIISTLRNVIEYNDQGKIKKAAIDSYANILYNGAAYPDYTAETLDIQNGRITLVDSKRSGVYDLVMIEEYETYFVSGTDTENNIIFGKYNEILKLGDYHLVSFYRADGTPDVIGSIKSNNVVSAFLSKDGEAAKIVVSDKSVHGKVQEVETTAKGGKRYIVDNATYDVSVSLLNAVERGIAGAVLPGLSEEYTLYLDAEDNIAGVDSKKAGVYYAYAIAVQKGMKLSEEGISFLRVLLQTGEFITVRSAQKVLVNKGALKEKGNKIAELPAFYKDGRFVPQLVKLTFGANGDITELETAAPVEENNSYGFHPDRFSLNWASGSAAWRVTSKTFGAQRAIFTDTPIFKIPSTNIGDESRYSVILPAAMHPSSAINYNVKLYDIDASLSAKACVLTYDVINPRFENAVFYIETAKRVLDENNQLVYRIRGYHGNAYYELTEDREGIVEAQIGADRTLKCGDVLRIVFDRTSKKFSEMRFLRSLADETEPYGFDIDGGGFDTGLCYIMYGFVYYKSDASISIVTALNPDNPNFPPPTAVKTTSPTASTACLVFDAKSKTLKKISYIAVAAPSVVKNDGSMTVDDSIMVFACRADSYLDSLVIIYK